MDLIEGLAAQTKNRVRQTTSSFVPRRRLPLIPSRLETIPVSSKNLDEAIKSASKMITDHERFLSEVKRTSGQGLQGVRSEYKSLEVHALTKLDLLHSLCVYFE